MKRRNIKYPVLMADTKTMNNFGGVYGIPVSFLVNREGNVVKKYPEEMINPLDKETSFFELTSIELLQIVKHALRTFDGNTRCKTRSL